MNAPWPPSRPASCAFWSPPTSPPAASTSTASRTSSTSNCPIVPEAYVHRIGRTARAGADGSAISFVAGDEMKLLRDIEKVTRQKIPATDRRNDKSLGLLDQSIMAAGVGTKASMPDDGRGDRQQQRGPAAIRAATASSRRVAASRTASRKAGPGRDARPTPERRPSIRWPASVRASTQQRPAPTARRPGQARRRDQASSAQPPPVQRRQGLRRRAG